MKKTSDFVPLETTLDENGNISASLNGEGVYSLVDIDAYFQYLGVDVKIEDGVAPQTMSYGFAPPVYNIESAPPVQSEETIQQNAIVPESTSSGAIGTSVPDISSLSVTEQIDAILNMPPEELEAYLNTVPDSNTIAAQGDVFMPAELRSRMMTPVYCYTFATPNIKAPKRARRTANDYGKCQNRSSPQILESFDLKKMIFLKVCEF